MVTSPSAGTEQTIKLNGKNTQTMQGVGHGGQKTGESNGLQGTIQSNNTKCVLIGCTNFFFYKEHIGLSVLLNLIFVTK